MSQISIVWDLNGVLYKDFVLDLSTYEIVKRIRKKDIKQYICTNTRKSILENRLEELTKDRYFEKIYSTVELGYLKPHPKAFQLIKEEIPTNRVLLIDNSRDNIQAAISVGIEGIVYISDIQLKQDLKLLNILK